MLSKKYILGRRILILLLCYAVLVAVQFTLLVLCKSLIPPLDYATWVLYLYSLGALFFVVNLIFFLLNHLFPETIIAISMLTMILKMGGALFLIYPVINSPIIKDNIFIGYFITLYLGHLGIELFVRKKILLIT